MQGQTAVQAQIGRAPDQAELDKWYADKGLVPDKDGIFTSMPYDKPPVERTTILEQVEANAQRHDVPNLPPREYTPKTMVYVGGGPSLKHFLDDVRRKCEDDNYDVVASNNTCAYLLSKGIKPNYHLILDPTERKKKDLEYDEDVELYLGLQCHPALFEYAKAKGRKVHKFLAASVKDESGKSDRDFAQKACTRDDPYLAGIGGGSMCGTRMIYFASIRGYRKLEYYGFDGSIEYNKKENVIRCYAYNKPRGENILETTASNGRVFYTTMSLARQGEELVQLLDILPGMQVEIFGDSLLKNQLEIYKAVRHQSAYRITPEYLEIQKGALLGSPTQYGVTGGQNASRVFMAGAQIHRKFGACTILDYGCGQGTLKRALQANFPIIPGLDYLEYDPCIVGKDAEPEPCDIVYCGDVMEHVEPECIEAVVKHIHSLSGRMSIYMISLRTSSKTLPDGRNAHITVRAQDWWLSWLKKYNIIVEEFVDQQRRELVAICKPLR